MNKDGILDAAELNEFQVRPSPGGGRSGFQKAELTFLVSSFFSQRKCFSSPLQLQEIEGLMRMIADHDPTMIQEGGINEAGILFFHTRFIQQGRVDTVWIVLTTFGYGDDLELKEEVLRPKSASILRLTQRDSSSFFWSDSTSRTIARSSCLRQGTSS